MAQKATIDAINTMVVGLKADGVWDKITEAYLMAGVTFGGITVKLKYLDIGETDIITPTLLNGGFETAGGGGADVFADWVESTSGSSTVNRDTVEFDTGLASCRFDIDGAGNYCSLIVSNALSVNVRYDYSIRVKGDGGGGTVAFGNVNGSQLNIVPTTEWTTFSGTFTSDGTTLEIKRGNGSSSSVWIDNVTLTKVPTKTLTNNNFVTGDYLGVGTGAGLTGDGSTKYLDTGLLDSSLTKNDKSLGVYISTASTQPNYSLMGSQTAVAQEDWVLQGTQTSLRIDFPDNDLQTTDPFGHLVGSRVSDYSQTIYKNGSNLHYIGSNPEPYANSSFTHYVFCRNKSGSPFQQTDATLTFAHIGTGLTDTDASNLSARVNTLMTALGCNTY